MCTIHGMYFFDEKKINSKEQHKLEEKSRPKEHAHKKQKFMVFCATIISYVLSFFLPRIIVIIFRCCVF